ncbi:hypothetical protein ACJX0J_026382, partial [Zea mays]
SEIALNFVYLYLERKRLEGRDMTTSMNTLLASSLCLCACLLHPYLLIVLCNLTMRHLYM